MILKNINHATVMSLKDQVAYQEGQIVSKTLVQSMSVGITLFSFWKGELSARTRVTATRLSCVLTASGVWK